MSCPESQSLRRPFVLPIYDIPSIRSKSGIILGVLPHMQIKFPCTVIPFSALFCQGQVQFSSISPILFNVFCSY